MLVATELGQGPDLVLLHGVGVGPTSFLELGRGLAGDHRVRIVRRPGDADRAVPLAEQAAAVAALMAGFGGRPATLVGVSGGATLALAVAMAHPEVVGRLVVHEPLVGPLAPALHERFQRAATRAATSDDEALAVVKAVMGDETWASASDAVREESRSMAGWARLEVPLFAAFAPDPGALAALGRGPVLVTVGERSLPERHEAADVLATLVDGSVAVIAGSGNAPQLDGPELLATAIGAWRSQPIPLGR